MKPKDFDKRIQAILGDTLEYARNNSIVSTDDGFVVFDRYMITNQDGVIQVTNQYRQVSNFTSQKTALTWCIFDKFNQVKNAQDTMVLDQRRRMVQDDLSLVQQLFHRYRDPVVRDSVAAKLSQKRQTLLDINSRLEKCANLAKYWQTKGFNDEIARTQHSAPKQKY